jgi:hypothetical protein
MTAVTTMTTAAMRENDTVYLQRIPPAEALDRCEPEPFETEHGKERAKRHFQHIIGFVNYEWRSPFETNEENERAE